LSEYIINASLPELQQEEDVFKAKDPFNKTWEHLKTLSGIEKNFKRREDRSFAKAYDTAQPTNTDLTTAQYANAANTISVGDGASSKQINPGNVFRNGYGIFDVITPPWNLYELANYYDTSFANHAAIDAKVENIVGLGFDFEMSKRTLLKLESTENPDATTRARKRIERAKVELTDWLENLNKDDSFTHTMMKFYTDVRQLETATLRLEERPTEKSDMLDTSHPQQCVSEDCVTALFRLLAKRLSTSVTSGQRTRTRLLEILDQMKYFTTKNIHP
jgi:capsid portal protein